MMRFFILILFCFLFSCNSIEQTEIKTIKERNKKKDYIHRKDNQVQYPDTKPLVKVRDPYPWELQVVGSHPRITKESFRCKGDARNKPLPKAGEKGVLFHDCGGVLGHSLPVKGGKEFIYPILLDLLNYIQLKTDAPVVVTCGHRCPAHNSYADPSVYQMSSKHMIGAEVDFYVVGLEGKPEVVIEHLMEYFKETPTYQGRSEYTEFRRLSGVKLDVTTPPWHNKEVLINLYTKNEGRDLDNKHPYPYISLQVRFDREKSERVIYSWERAFNGYMRY